MKRSKSALVGRRFRPTVERLEDRTVPAGNVAASIIGGNLFVVGDAAANQLVIGQWGERQIALASLDGTTTINGSLAPVVLSGFDGGAYIWMGDGNDILSLIGVNPKTDLTVDMQGGDDTLWLTAVSTRKPATLTGGNGGDAVHYIASSINGFLPSSFEGVPIVRARADAATVAEGGTVNINVATNDSASMGSLDLTSIVITQQPTNGTVTVNANGTIDYTHNGSETSTDNFRYRISDQDGRVSNQGTVTITITPVNDNPLANDDSATVAEGGSVLIDLADNDTDADSTLDLTSIVITTQPTNGTVTVNADGTVTYMHDGSETTTDTFTYTIEDTQGGTSNQATVTVTITPVDDPPVAGDDSDSVNEGGTVIIDVADNDTDAEGVVDLNSIVITQQPTHGTVIVHADGTVTYMHNGSETTADSFRYTITDLTGSTSNEATVLITITPQNDAPVAVNDGGTVANGGMVNIDLAMNDTDEDSALDLTSIVITQMPANGSVTVNTDGTVDYTHDGSATTSDSFTYTIMDVDGATSNEATVDITIT